MTDRFDEMAWEILMTDGPYRVPLAAALRAQHKAGQEAMRKLGIEALTSCMLDVEQRHKAVQILRALPIEEPTP